MAVDKSKSLIMAQRLKELRNENGLSHESLRKALMEKYEIDISVDSLKNYEVSKTPHVKAYKNDGMRVEYLRCLADFYNVSADYILGISDIKSADKGIQTIIKNTGLSEESATVLHALYMANNENFDSSMIKSVLPIPSNFSSEGDYRYVAALGQSFINDLIGSLTEDETILRRYGALMTALIMKTQHDEKRKHPTETSEPPFFSEGHIAVPIDDYISFLTREVSEEIYKYLSFGNKECISILQSSGK